MESQNKQIKEYLNHGNKITSLDALEMFGCMRLASRINDLKKQGMGIGSKTVEFNMRYYWEALFSVEYFPYWEFTMLMVLLLNLSMLLRVHKIQEDIKRIKEKYNGK